MLPSRQQLSNTPWRFPEDLELRQTDWPHRHAPLVPAPLQDLHSPRSDPRRASEARSEEHTSELQSLLRISYAIFCFKKKKRNHSKTVYKVPQMHIIHTIFHH